MTKWIAVALAAMSLTACGPSESEKTNALIVERVKASLKDPDSAKVAIREIFPLFDGQIACGTVNAKNSFGGYTGDREFLAPILPSDSLGAIQIAADEEDSQFQRASCGFLKEYSSRDGSKGSAPSPEQMKALLEEYKAFSFKVAAEIYSAK